MDTLEIHGQTFVLTPIDEYMDEKVGREEIRSYLECDRMTLFRKPWVFPDFGVALQGKRGAKPYSRKQVLDWLSIPEKKRKRLYEEYIGDRNEANKQD